MEAAQHIGGRDRKRRVFSRGGGGGRYCRVARGLWDTGALEGAKKRVEADLQNDDGKKKKKIRVLKECAD